MRADASVIGQMSWGGVRTMWIYFTFSCLMVGS